jgi:hypothetical protein
MKADPSPVSRMVACVASPGAVQFEIAGIRNVLLFKKRNAETFRNGIILFLTRMVSLFALVAKGPNQPVCSESLKSEILIILAMFETLVMFCNAFGCFRISCNKATLDLSFMSTILGLGMMRHYRLISYKIKHSFAGGKTESCSLDRDQEAPAKRLQYF